MALTALTACGGPAAPPPDAPMPTDSTRANIDFAPVYASIATHNLVMASSREAGLLRRVMVSPNIVFESSRSSLPDPHVTGPANPTPSSPDFPDALGHPVSIPVSSMLLQFLIDHGSSIVAPVISRMWCGGDDVNCQPATWVERTLAMAHAAPGATAVDAPGAESNRFTLPTSLLAVRRLGYSFVEVAVAVYHEGHGWEVRVVPGDSGSGLCPDLRATVPVLAFSAEIISASSGQVIARIDESRSVPVRSVSLQREITTARFTPVRVTTGIGQVYIEEWNREDLSCDSIRTTLQAIQNESATGFDVQGPMQDLIRTTLDPVYRAETNTDRPRRAARVEEPPPAPPPAAAATMPTAAPAAVNEADGHGQGHRRRRR